MCHSAAGQRFPEAASPLLVPRPIKWLQFHLAADGCPIASHCPDPSIVLNSFQERLCVRVKLYKSSPTQFQNDYYE